MQSCWLPEGFTLEVLGCLLCSQQISATAFRLGELVCAGPSGARPLLWAILSAKKLHHLGEGQSIAMYQKLAAGRNQRRQEHLGSFCGGIRLPQSLAWGL